MMMVMMMMRAEIIMMMTTMVMAMTRTMSCFLSFLGEVENNGFDQYVDAML